MPLPCARAASTSSRPRICVTSAATCLPERSHTAGSSASSLPALAMAARRVAASV